MVTGLASRESLSLINLVSHIGLGGPVDRAKDMLGRWTGAELLGGTGDETIRVHLLHLRAVICLQLGLLAGRSGDDHGNGKARILPLRPSTVAALECYLRHPKRPSGIAATDPIFVPLRRRRLSHSAAENQ
jgi:hypothetical protein